MKTAAIRRLRGKLAAQEPVYGLWITLESPSITEMAVALGLDWLVIDAEHGHLDWKEILEHLRATVRSDTVALVRVSELNPGLIKRSLDIGADGILVPWVETAEQLQQAMKFAMYPPEGIRGIGAERATAWGQCFAEHTQEANDHVLVVPIIETITAGRNIQQICNVKGVEILFFGPADYSSSAGYRGQWEGPGVAAELQKLKQAIVGYGKHCGIMATSTENLIERTQQGFRMLGVGSDTGLLLRSLHGALSVAGRDRRIQSSLEAERALSKIKPLARPPESLRPDRPEVISGPGKNSLVELAPGVSMDCLIGAHNNARRLSTALLTFKPGAKTDYHVHPVSKSITVLGGRAIVAVEGREYLLGLLDTIMIPRKLDHAIRNSSTAEGLLVHTALASEAPTRNPTSIPYERRAVPSDSTGVAGKERVTRFYTAPRFEAGPGTSFVDHFNGELMPGLEMSGGYGLFAAGGRLPAHFHDADEVICVVQGTATCVVEGRRHQMTNGSTALQPRGRVHYFSNESTEPMALIWVYAGPTLEQVIVEERCATVEGDPWKEPAPRDS